MREQLGRRSLQGDALYCAALGALLVALRRPAGRRLAVTPSLVGLGGAATLVWACGVAAVSRRRPARPLAVVGTANVLAATTLIAAGLRDRDPARRWLLAATGIEVASFAASQALALGLAEKRAA